MHSPGLVASAPYQLPRGGGPAPQSTVVVLFPTRERLLDAAWKLLTAVDDLKRRDALDPDSPIVVCMSRYEKLRPELFLSSAAYQLASSINIRMRDTEAAASDSQPAHCVLLIDTSPSSSTDAPRLQES